MGTLYGDTVWHEDTVWYGNIVVWATLLSESSHGGSRCHLYNTDLTSCSLAIQMPVGKAVTLSTQGPDTATGQRGARDIMSVTALGAVPHEERARTTPSIHYTVNTRLVPPVNSTRTIHRHSDFLAMLIPLWGVEDQKESPNKTDIILNSGEMVECVYAHHCVGDTHEWWLILLH